MGLAGAILFSKVEEATSRFPDFVPTLQSFFSDYGLPVGAAEALPELAERVSADGAFRDDLISMLSVLCADEKRISYLELLGLLLVAAVGQELAQELALDAGAEEPVRRMFNFVVEARRPRGQDELAAAEAGPDHDHFAGPGDFPAEEVIDIAEPVPPIGPVVQGRAMGSPSRGSVLARALAIAADEDGFGSNRAPVAVSAPEPARVAMSGPEPVPVALSAPEPVRVDRSAPVTEPLRPSFAQEPLGKLLGRRVPVWAVGLAGVLLGLLISFLWGKHGAPAPVALTGAAASPAAPAEGAAERTAKRRERVARSAREEVDAAFAGAALPSTERDPASEGRPAPSNTEPAEARRSAKPARPRAAAVPVDRGGAAPPSAPVPAARAVRPVPDAMVPSVRAVDLSAPAEIATQGRRGGRTRVPSVVTGSSGIMAANVISAPPPAYPEQASAARVEGEVVIEAVVGRDGTVKTTRVVSGPEMLRQAALYAVQHWRYRPYEVDGTPAEIATTARLQFRLHGE